MKIHIIIMLCVIAWLGICLAFTGSAAKERDRRYTEFFQTMKDQNCKRTGFVGRDAIPVWTCPDGTAYKEGRL